MKYNLLDLNPIQLKITLDTEGAVLVTAGAGSGKTRLLTHRISHIICDLGIPSANVLAITFTNKATNEMKERLSEMLPFNNNNVWISTFHSMCAKILRENIDKLEGYDRNFTVFDDSDRDKLLKSILKDDNCEDADGLKNLSNLISNAKNLGLNSDEYMIEYPTCDVLNVKRYDKYQKKLMENNAVDFDDLLLKTLELFYKCPSVLKLYQEKFRYIHVDEFQDTNLVQYKIIKLLAGFHKNIFVVGDEDQCIYCWRGANILNISNFKLDFDCKIYKLEQNYRSTKNIINKANLLIKNNVARIDKTLFTNNQDGEEVSVYNALDEGAESEYVVNSIYNLNRNGVQYKDIGILMRVSALSRLIEEKLLNYNIPYKVAGIFKFFERLEIKNILAYLRVLNNHKDNYALTKIINYPRRSIGEATILKLGEIATNNNISLFELITNCEKYSEISSNVRNKIVDFKELLIKLDSEKEEQDLLGIVSSVINLSGIKSLYNTLDEDDVNRKMNIDQLLQSVESFSKNNENADLTMYLESVTLENNLQDEESDSKVSISTVHASKGLEFDYVFIIGAEEGRFPLIREDDLDMEEERRLMYVAITRARKKLYITRAKSRFMYGKRDFTVSSRFIKEMDLEKNVNLWGGFTNQDNYKKQGAYYKNRTNYNANNNKESVGFEESLIEGNKAITKNSFITTDKTKQLEKELAALFKANITEDKYAKFVVGALVSHDKFGIGKIIKKEELGDNTFVSIQFEKIGVKTLSLTFAPLKIIESDQNNDVN